jgi:hypothetical protein
MFDFSRRNIRETEAQARVRCCSSCLMNIFGMHLCMGKPRKSLGSLDGGQLIKLALSRGVNVGSW